MSLPVANVDITTDTFGIWIVKTNTLAYYMSNYVVTVDQTASGNSSTGNGYIIGNFGSTLLFANSELRGGNVSSTGTLNISSNVSLSNTISISGSAILSNNFSVVGNVSFSNTLSVTGNVTISNSANIAGSVDIGGSFSATGATTLRNSLSVNNAITASNTLTLAGLANLNGGLNTTTANTTTAINIGANVNINTTSFKITNGTSNTIITNNSIIIGNSTVNTSISTTTINSGNLNLTSSISVGNSTVNSYINSSSITMGNTTLTSNSFIVDKAIVRGDLTVNGNFFVSATLTVNGSMIPLTNNLYDLGSSANNFRSAYIITLNSNSGVFGSSITVGNSTVNSTINSTSFSGRANSANTLTTARNIGVTGDVVASNTSFNGSSNINITVTLANTSVIAGNNFTKFNVDSKGRVTNASSITNSDIITILGYVPANISGDTFTNNVIFNGNVSISNNKNLTLTGALIANGSSGSATQVLHSNGTSIYWDTDDQGVTSIISGNGLTGGTITTNGTIAVLANSGIVSNSTGVYVLANSGIVSNSTGVYVNTAFINAQRANSANTLTTARNIGVTGDVVASNTSFNGSSNINITVTLANSGVTAGEYSKVTVDSKGRVTNGAYISNADVISALGFTPVSANASGTIDGNLSLMSTSGGRSLAIDGPVSIRDIQFKTNGADRFVIRVTNNAESGSDAGSNFAINRVSDANVSSNVMQILRSSGLVSFFTQVNFPTANHPTLGTTRKLDAFPSGTRMLFVQTAAPTGWTKDTNGSLNHALRITGGTAGYGGSWGFTDAFTVRGITGSVQSTTLSYGQMPIHNHGAYSDVQGDHNHTATPGLTPALVNQGDFWFPPGSSSVPGNYIGYTGSIATSQAGNHAHNIGIYNAGNNESHTHGLTINNLNMSVAYVDAIMATKD